MHTNNTDGSAASALLGKSSRAVLSLLFAHADELFYLRQIVRLSGLAVGSIQRELKRLTDAGIITRRVHGRQVYFRANAGCPVFRELKGILVKTAGLADVLRTALAPLADRIRVAFVFGSITTGREERGSDVDVMVIGDVSSAEVAQALGAAKNTLHRAITPAVYPPGEFVAKISAGRRFLKLLVDGEKIFLIGSDNDFVRLTEKTAGALSTSPARAGQNLTERRRGVAFGKASRSAKDMMRLVEAVQSRATRAQEARV